MREIRIAKYTYFRQKLRAFSAYLLIKIAPLHIHKRIEETLIFAQFADHVRFRLAINSVSDKFYPKSESKLRY